jgi:hypothetical protein
MGQKKNRKHSLRESRERVYTVHGTEPMLGEDGTEKWQVRDDTGRKWVITTTGTSVAAMDDAVEKYSGALRRLAKR